MQILEILVPDDKIRLVKKTLKEFGVIVNVKKRNITPNADSIAAMNELREGNGRKFRSVYELFDSI
jgi:hypothetical protein